MGRISRKCYESTFFHVMVQGIKKEKIFNKSKFKEKYLLFLTEATERYDVKIIAYCIMGNHAHILFYTDKIEKLSKVMASTNTKYALFYNKIKERCGYVYRDRYRCENIYTQNYLENCIRYIHNNPVKAQICSTPDKYEYSSYNKYIDNQMSHEVISLVFGDESNYIERLNGDVQDNSFIDVENEFGDKKFEKVEDVINEFSNMDYKNSEEIGKIAHELLCRCKINRREVAQVLGIERTKLYRIMKKVRI